MSDMVTLLIASRTGSTMTARIFAGHGFRHKMKGTPGQYYFEDQEVRDWVKARFKQNHDNPKPIPSELVADFQGFIKRHDIELFKGNAFWFPLFEPLKPKIISVIRNLDSAAKSLQDKNPLAKKMSIDEIKRIKQCQYDYADAMIQKHGGCKVYTDQLIDGDYSSIRTAIEYCGKQFDESIAQSVIDPKQWHF